MFEVVVELAELGCAPGSLVVVVGASAFFFSASAFILAARASGGIFVLFHFSIV